MVEDFFADVTGPIPFGGLGSTEALSFKVYEPDRLVLGKRMEDHLRPGVCFWHSFAWPGVDMFGSGTMDRPWLDGATDEMAAARTKMAVAFEFFTKLGIPYYCFHDRDVAPEGATFATFRSNLDALTDDAAGYQERTGVRLLWGTANLFTHPRYQAGAATNPDPEVFAFAAAQVKHMLEVTKRLGGENYVLWGGREGYDTLLNTDLRARRRPARAIPAPRRGAQAPDRLRGPASHRAEADGAHQAPVRLRRRDGPRLPRQARAGGRVPREHRGEPRDAGGPQLPSRGGLRGRERRCSAASTPTGATRRTAGTPTSSRTRSRTSRCRSTRSCATAASPRAASTSTPSSVDRARDRTDLFHAHIGALDTLARALLVAADLVERGDLDDRRERRYAAWGGPLGTAILDGGETLETLEAKVAAGTIDPRPTSGHQELLENVVNHSVWAADASGVKSGTSS